MSVRAGARPCVCALVGGKLDTVGGTLSEESPRWFIVKQAEVRDGGLRVGLMERVEFRMKSVTFVESFVLFSLGLICVC